MPHIDQVQRDKATILSILKYLLYILIGAAVIYSGFTLFWIMMPFVVAFILAEMARIFARGWLNMIYRIGHHKRKAAHPDPSASGESSPLVLYPKGLDRSRKEVRTAMVFYVLEILAVIALVIGVVIGSFQQLSQLAEFLPDFVQKSDLAAQITNWIAGISEKLGGIFQADFLATINQSVNDLKDQLISAMPSIVAAILNWLAAVASYLPFLLFLIIVVVMSGYYFIVDSRKLYLFIRRNLPSKSFRENSIKLVNSLSKTLFRVIGGYSLLLIMTFIEALIGLLIIQMPYAVIIAMVAAVADFLPVIGIAGAMIPVSIFMFINGNVFGGIGALVIIVVAIIVRRIVEPPLMGNAMNIHPMAGLASMIVGIGLYGFPGLLLGPIILVVAKEVMTLYGFDKKFRKFIGNVLNKVSD